MMDTSSSTTKETLQIPKDFFITDRSKAFLATHGTNFKTFFTPFASQSHHKPEDSAEKEPPHIDIYFPTSDEKTQTSPEWYGTRLAKQQAYQEQRVFAKKQCVRFGGCGDWAGATCYDYGDDDDDDGADDEKGHGEHRNEDEDKQPWQSSQLAKTFAAKEQKLFKTMARRCKRIEEEVEEEEFSWRESDRRQGDRRRSQ